jgi:hypothetical protein
VVLSLSLCALAAPPALAAEDGPTTEIFTGIGVEENSTQGYVGAGFAFGKGLYAPGWRLRAVGAFGGLIIKARSAARATAPSMGKTLSGRR